MNMITLLIKNGKLTEKFKNKIKQLNKNYLTRVNYIIIYINIF